MAWVRSILFGLSMSVLLLSACIGPPALDRASEQVLPEPEYREVHDERSFSGSVTGVRVHTDQPNPVSPEWRFSLPPDTHYLELSLTWESPVNDYTFVLESPEGAERYELQEASSSEAAWLEGPSFDLRLEDPSAGEYTAFFEARYVFLEDEFTLHAEWVHTITVYPAGFDGALGEDVGSFSFTKEGNAWRAERTIQSAGSVDDPVTLDVSTFNGRIEVHPTRDDEASVDVSPWGRAATQERAEELARSVEVTLEIDGGTLKAHAKKGSGVTTSGTESIGARIVIHVPVEITGSLKTSNGRIVLDDLVASDLDAKTSNGRIVADLETSGNLVLKTSNGRIKADLRGSGDINLDTSNGRIELGLTPVDDIKLGLDTSNGRIKADLKESGSIGYRLDAKTSNSKISSDMSEAELDGDDKKATLETDGFAQRTIQVTGDVRTSNGKIEFKGT